MQVYKYVLYDDNTGEVKLTSNIEFDMDLEHNKNYSMLILDSEFYTENNIKVINGKLTEIEVINYKAIRQNLIDNIEVTYNSTIYQGDEDSQSRMSRAINGLPDNTTTIKWKAKDNSSHELNKEDLKQILFLAGQEQTRIWFLETLN